MPKVTESVLIAAAQPKVFEFISDAKRAPTFVPGLNRISNLSTPTAQVGRTWEFEFNWFGLTISGKTECRRLEAPNLYQFQTIAGAASTWTYRCEAKDGKTQLTLEVEYEVPQNLLGRVAAQPVLERMNQNRARETVGNLKVLLEG